MITDADVKKLKNSFKDTFSTKNDLQSMEKRQYSRFATKDDLKDLRSQISDDVDGKLANQKQEILEEVDIKLDVKLKKQKDEIVKDVAEYIVDTIVPEFDERDKRANEVTN